MNNDANWPFKIEKILRVIPEKRMTAIAYWQNQKVIAKVFLSHVFGKVNFQKELKNNLWLQEHHITVPRILMYGPLSANSFYLLMHYYEHAISFEQLWLNLTNEKDKIFYFQTLKNFIEQIHQVGAYQNDLHLKNFLIENEQLIALDTGSFMIEPKIFSSEAAARNWGKLLAQFDEEEAMWLNETFFKTESSIFLYEKEWRKRRIQHYLKKIFRNGTDFFSERTWSHYFVYQKNNATATLNLFFKDPEAYLKKHTLQIIKAGNACTVLLVKFGEKKYVIKRFNITSRWRQIKRIFKSSRTTRNWYYAHYLQCLNVPVVKPIGFYEKRFGLFRKEGYLIMEYISGPSLLHYIQQHGFNQQSKIYLSQAISFIKKLSQYHIQHGDMKATNFLIHENQVMLIDLDAMQKVHYKNQKDAERFIRNWLDFPEIKQYVVEELEKKDSHS